jgi:hypothetical protein
MMSFKACDLSYMGGCKTGVLGTIGECSQEIILSDMQEINGIWQQQKERKKEMK